MGRPETLENIKTLRLGGVLFIPVPEGKTKVLILKTFNLKCWREANRNGKQFQLGYDMQKGVEGIKIKRTL
jgi:hypothetical protein